MRTPLPSSTLLPKSIKHPGKCTQLSSPADPSCTPLVFGSTSTFKKHHNINPSSSGTHLTWKMRSKPSPIYQKMCIYSHPMLLLPRKEAHNSICFMRQYHDTFTDSVETFMLLVFFFFIHFLSQCLYDLLPQLHFGISAFEI